MCLTDLENEINEALHDVKRLLDKAASCSVCPSPSRAKGFCTKHYQRFKKHGSPFAKKLRYNPRLLDDYRAGVIDDLFARGYTVKAIAKHYGVSTSTVERHCPRIEHKRGTLTVIKDESKLKQLVSGLWK